MFLDAAKKPCYVSGRRGDSMRRLWTVCWLGFFLLPVTAEETVPNGFEQWTAASLKQIEGELRTEAGKDAHHLGLRRLGDFPNDLFLFAHREADGQPEWHETQADVFVVQSGTATLVVGGTMVGAQDTEPHEKRNGTIQGGVRRKMSAGDIIRIPAKTPHQVLLDGGREFTYFVVKVKGY
jgi:mannose-6-phosphate isomerase-like protein (cupin superfamily)